MVYIVTARRKDLPSGCDDCLKGHLLVLQWSGIAILYRRTVFLFQAMSEAANGAQSGEGSAETAHQESLRGKENYK